jgi:hypothetical protein
MPRCFGIFALTGLIGTAGCGDGSGARPPDRCLFEPIAPDQSIDGESPLELSRGIEGTHTAPLSWFETELVALDSGDPLLEDELTLNLGYDGGEARSGCGKLGIEMNAAFATRESAVIASGAVWVEFHRPPRFRMRLPSDTCTDGKSHASGGFTLVDGEHSVVAGVAQYPEGALLSGRLRTKDPDAPGEFAWFPGATTCERTELPTSEAFEPTAQEILAAIAELDPESVPWESEVGALELELSADGSSLCDALGLATLPVSGTVAPPDGPRVSMKGWLSLLHQSGDPRVTAFGLSLEPTQDVDRGAFLPVSRECDIAIEWYATVLPGNVLEVTRATPFSDCDCR